MGESVRVHEVDFSDPHDVGDYIEMLDAYARDPMGAGRPLADEVKQRLRADLATLPSAHALLAQRGGQSVGFATCFLGYSTFRAHPLLNLHDIAVRREARGLGVATALLHAVDALALRLGCCKVTLEVRGDNTAAQRAYEQAGFVPAACERFMEKLLQEHPRANVQA